mgnify:FL=1
MKRTIGAVAVLAFLATPAVAGDYHTGTSLNCADCHVMHYSQSHGYSANGGGFYVNPYAGGPFEFLLRGEINDMCLACHDGSSFAPDVLGNNTGSAIRQGGALNRPGFNDAGYFDSTGHTLDSIDVAPGGTWASTPSGVSQGLNCVDCHSQHGRGGASGASLWRNLNSGLGTATTWGSAEVTYVNTPTVPATPFTVDIWQKTQLVFDESNVEYLEPDNTLSAMADWCAACHENFHGALGGAEVGGHFDGTNWEEFVRHPSAGVNIGAIGGGHSNLNMYKEGNRNATPNGKTNFVKVMSETGVWGNTATAADGLTPTCISCHKAHGNKNAFGLIYRQGTGLLSEEGDAGGGQYENLCGQCHVQGAAFAVP